MSTKAEKTLARIEAQMIENSELEQLGHRIVYDKKTGHSTNVPGCYCDPKLLGKHGYQIRLKDVS